MKRNLVSLLVFLSLSSMAQDRVQKPKTSIPLENVGQLTEAKGWMLNPEQEWVSLDKTIPSYIKSEHKLLLTHEQSGLGVDNFISYQLKQVEHEGVQYYILIKKFRDGFYEYPSIRRGWIGTTSCRAYVFEKQELDKLQGVIDGQINLIEIRLVDIVDLRWVDQNKTLELISLKIKWGGYNDRTALILHIAPYQEKGIVQFQVYERYGDFNIISGVRVEHKPLKEGSSYDRTKIYLSDELFSHCYYETSYDKFNKFLPIKF